MNHAPENQTRGSSRENARTSSAGFVRNGALIALGVVGALLAVGLWVIAVRGITDESDTSRAGNGPAASAGAPSPFYTTARRSMMDGVREYFAIQSTPTQPIQFNHSIHIKNGLLCEFCHAGVTQGPDAGIPSVSFCMTCHQAIATDRPEIKKLAAYAAKGEEPPWQPVFWFYPEVHVRFRHSPHIKNGIACEQCHGDMSQRTVAVKSKDLTMNFCLSCHKQKAVSVDCVICHY
jgi:cytochrome c7-like protein